MTYLFISVFALVYSIITCNENIFLPPLFLVLSYYVGQEKARECGCRVSIWKCNRGIWWLLYIFWHMLGKGVVRVGHLAGWILHSKPLSSSQWLRCWATNQKVGQAQCHQAATAGPLTLCIMAEPQSSKKLDCPMKRISHYSNLHVTNKGFLFSF